MELLPIIRHMWLRRFPLAVGVVLSLAILIGMGGTTPKLSSTAVAWTSVAVDTQQSQLVDSAPAGGGTMPWRASLLESLMMTDAASEQLAQRLGVNKDQVLVVDNDLSLPLVTTDTATAASKAASDAAAPYTLTVFIQNNSLPVISIEASAKDSAGAQRLAAAGVAVLHSYASARKFTSLITTGLRGFKLQPLAISQVTPIRVKLLSSVSTPMKAIGLSAMLLIAWCVLWLTIIPRWSRRMRPRGRRPIAA